MIPEQRLSTTTLPSTYLYPEDQLITDTQDWEMGGVALLDSSQGLDYQAWTSSASGGAITLRALETNQSTLIYTKTGIIQHSFSFDQNMRWQLVYTLTNGNVEHIWYDASIGNYVTTVYSGGEQSPRLALDDKRSSQRTAADVLLFYIRNGGFYFRAQRDRYLLEYPLVAGFSPEILLLRVGMNSKWRLQFELTGEVMPPAPGPVPPPPPVPPPTFTILNGSIPIGYIGQSYSFTLSYKNGAAPISWSIDQGLLPPGLLLNQTTGMITGSPSITGTFNFAIKAIDDEGNVARRNITAEVISTADFHISGTVYPYAPASFVSSNSTTYANNYFGIINLVGGKPPYAAQVISGNIPTPYKIYTGDMGGKQSAWIRVPRDTLLAVSSNFTVASSHSFELQVTDADGNVAVTSQSFTIPRGPYTSAASPNVVPSMTSQGLIGTITVPYGEYVEATVTLSGGVPPYKFKRSNVQSGPILSISTMSGTQVKLSGYTTFSGPPDPWNYTYAQWIEAEDSRGGLGGNAVFQIMLYLKFTQP